MTREELYSTIFEVIINFDSRRFHGIVDKIWGQPFDGLTEKITERDTERDTETAEEKSLASAYGPVIRSRYRVDVQSVSGRWDNVEIRDDEAIARRDESEWRSWVNENRGQWKDVRIVKETTTAKQISSTSPAIEQADHETAEEKVAWLKILLCTKSCDPVFTDYWLRLARRNLRLGLPLTTPEPELNLATEQSSATDHFPDTTKMVSGESSAPTPTQPQ